ncbi:MAG: hypothetical protein PF487_04540 [Bacteroidales bacterium]|jgi:hypothetical protein|nr:hypothetical protein [Bacteroidales bacterium]
MGFEDSMYDDGFNNPQDYFDHLCNESYRDTWREFSDCEESDSEEYDEDNDQDDW